MKTGLDSVASVWMQQTEDMFRVAVQESCSRLVRSSKEHVENSRCQMLQMDADLNRMRLRISLTQNTISRSDDLLRELHRLLHF
jgi:hypothetical protein